MEDASQRRAHGRVGSVVGGKYRVDAFIATGTMASVYAATHRNGARVALKVLHKALAEDEGLCERFKREGYFANSIDHPGVVRAIDDDLTEDGCPYLVLELLEGETLDERRRRKGGRLPLPWVLGVADALLDVLGAAHARDVVHRDLKPDNVFVTKAGAVKVLDFGVARWADDKASSEMTAAGMVLGTPAFMPPEQALGRRESVDARSDLWAVGATLFVVLTGQTVHEGGDAKARLIATARKPARPIRDVSPDVPRAVAAVIDRALAFDKRERWPDAPAMREALRWARMGLEGDREGATSSALVGPDDVPAPVSTKRTLEDEDDEPTIALPRPDDVSAAPGPATVRDPAEAAGGDRTRPLAAASARGAERPPATERMPLALAPQADPARAAASQEETLAAPSHRTAPGIGPAVMPPAAPPPAAPQEQPAVPAEVRAEPPHDALAFPQPVPDAFGAPPVAVPAPVVYAPAPSVLPPPVTAYGSSPPAEASSAASLAPSRVSLPPEAPGPMLSQVVGRRSSPARILVPVVIGIAVVAGALALARRPSTPASNGLPPSVSVATPSAPAASGSSPPSASVTSTATAASTSATSATASAAPPASVTSPSAPLAAPSASAHGPKRPHHRKPRAPRPTATPVDPTSEPLPEFPIPETPPPPPPSPPTASPSPPTPSPTGGSTPSLHAPVAPSPDD